MITDNQIGDMILRYMSQMPVFVSLSDLLKINEDGKVFSVVAGKRVINNLREMNYISVESDIDERQLPIDYYCITTPGKNFIEAGGFSPSFLKKTIRYFKRNLLAIAAVIISLVALFKSESAPILISTNPTPSLELTDTIKSEVKKIAKDSVISIPIIKKQNEK